MSGPPTALVAHPSADLYGSDRVLLETLSGLVEGGYRTVLTVPAPGPLVEAALARGAEVRLCPSPILRKSALAPRGLFRTIRETAASIRPGRRLLSELKPEVVLVNTVTIPLWILLGAMGKVRTICHVHEAEASQPAPLLKLLYAPLLMAQANLVNSRFSLDVLARAWPRLRPRSVVIYNGVPGPRDEPLPLRVDVGGSPRLLFIGRLSPRKGPQVAVAALAELRRRGIHARLGLLGAVFPGYEWFESQLREQVASLQLEEHVDFLGFDPDVWKHLSDADIICVPSVVDEPFGNTAVEAMLAKRPLVVSDTSGLKEAAGGFASARFVKPDDASAIAAAVEELLAGWQELPELVAEDRRRALVAYNPMVYRTSVARAIRG